MKALVGGCEYALPKGSCSVIPVVAEWTNNTTGETFRFCTKHDESAKQVAAKIEQLPLRERFASYTRKEVPVEA